MEEAEMRQKIRRVLAVTLIAVFLLSGCKLFKKDIPTVISLTNAAITNMGKADSAEVKVNSTGDITATYKVMNIGINMSLDTDIDMEMTRNPERSKGTINLSLGLVGQEQSMNGEFYGEGSKDGTKTTYIRWKEGNWMKKTKAAQSDASDASSSNSSSGPALIPNSLVQVIGLMKAIADESITAELKEDTATINDKEAYQISFMLSGDFLKQFMDAGGMSLGGLSESGDSIDWTIVEIPAELYIYKESQLPARITMDCTSIGTQIIEGQLEGYMQDLPIGDIALSVNKYDVDITIDRYDEIEAIEIPAEAKNAAESESLMPNMTDIVKFW